MPAPLKTLFLMEDLCYGGTQRQNLALAARLNRDRFAPAMLTLTGATDLDGEAKAAAVPVLHLGHSRQVPPLFFALLPAMLKRHRPDILVCCTALPNIWGRIWGRVLGIPLVIGTVRGGGAPKRQHEWLLWRLAHGHVCNSAPLRDIMAACGVPEARLRHIPNGVDTDHFQPISQGNSGQNIVCVARLAKDKDHKTLIEAFAQIAPQFPQTRLQLVGEGPEAENLRQLAANSSAAAQIDFLGSCADAAPHLQRARIFALASVQEGLPNAILEAMACGLPVCATSVGGIPSLVTDNGLLSKPGDAVTLGRNLALLLNQPDQAEAMGRRGRQRAVQDYSFAPMVRKHEEFFLNLWHNRHSG